ncbi:MAG: isoprenyl transferase [Puniceicoccales bacterium]
MSQNNLPEHVAIIMDGNGRWARKRFLPRIEGHRQGVKNVRKLLESLADSSIRYLTLFAFSVENWQRPKEEVDALMELLKQFLRRESKLLVRNRIRLQTIGRREELPEEIQEELSRVMEETKEFEDHVLTLALNYGSRTEIFDATRKIADDLASGRIQETPTDWEGYRKYLYTGDIPDPDLIIRTSGEWRVSNFLLLQGAYAELYFCEIPWPEFTIKDFNEALASYSQRERRFGRVLPTPAEV